MCQGRSASTRRSVWSTSGAIMVRWESASHWTKERTRAGVVHGKDLINVIAGHHTGMSLITIEACKKVLQDIIRERASANQCQWNGSRPRKDRSCSVKGDPLVGGGIGKNYSMASCCNVMLEAVRPGDRILAGPPSRHGATLTILYVLPR